MSDEEFLARWSRRKQEAKAGHADTRPDRSREAHEPALSDRHRGKAGSPRRWIFSSLPPIEFDRRCHRHHGFPAQRHSAGVEPCGASSRLGGRSRHPRLRRAGRECLGLQRPECDAGLRTARLFGGAACDLVDQDRWGRGAAPPTGRPQSAAGVPRPRTQPTQRQAVQAIQPGSKRSRNRRSREPSDAEELPSELVPASATGSCPNRRDLPRSAPHTWRRVASVDFRQRL